MKKIDFPNGKFAIYDDNDYELIKTLKITCQYNSKADKHYVITAINNKTIILSRFLMNPKNNELVIYKNGETLDNRRTNLLVVNKSENQSRIGSRRKGEFKGVSLIKSSNNYRAAIRYKGKDYHLGCYEFAKDAAEAYNKKAKELYGELAYQNKI